MKDQAAISGTGESVGSVAGRPSKPIWDWIKAKPCNACPETEDECWSRVKCHELEAWRKEQPNAEAESSDGSEE